MSDTTSETWLYAGRRLGERNRVLHAWADEHDKVLLFDKVRGSSIGAAYAVEVIRSDDAVSVRGNAQYAMDPERTAAPEDVEEWRARDAATAGKVAAAKAEKRAAADSELEDALNVLRRHYGRLRSYGERQGFANYVASEATRPYKEEL